MAWDLAEDQGGFWGWRRQKPPGTGVGNTNARPVAARRVPQMGDYFPNFQANTTAGKIDFYDWAEGHWVCLFSHPAIVSGVSATEFAALGAARDDFAQRNVKLLGLACEGAGTHRRWTDEVGGLFRTRIDFPVVEDLDGALSRRFGMIVAREGAEFNVRKTYFINPALKVALVMEYPINVGRSVEETLRAIDGLQMTQAHRLGIPADWEPGQPCMVAPYVETAKAEKNYGKVDELRPWLRIVACPPVGKKVDAEPSPPQDAASIYEPLVD